MENGFFIFLYFVMWYSLVITVIIFVISGIDDLFFDMCYWILLGYKKFKTRHIPNLTFLKMVETPEKRLAIMTPCWDESNVIFDMLMHNCKNIEYEKFDIFIGVYPNDPETIKAVEHAQKYFPNVHPVIGADDGPTNKGKNLNQVYRYIKEYEKEIGETFAAFILHDAEDMIHPLSLKLYNYLLPEFDMIQIPVFPLEVGIWNFTHWVYCDEFAETHTKDIIVRDRIKGHVPSAGVGTAFSARAMQTLKDINDGEPFTTDSLTEDYSTALKLKQKKLKLTFVGKKITTIALRKKYFLFGDYVTYKKNEYIATRAFFPMSYYASVRQKARWIFGISIQEWMHSGWSKGFTVRYTLLHDRKALFAHVINIFAYMVMLFWLLYSALTFFVPEYPTLQERLDSSPWVWDLILLATVLMVMRFFQRFVASLRLYPLLPSLLSIPRVFYGNIINLHALLRAVKNFLFEKKIANKPPAWDKTHHHFPNHGNVSIHKNSLGEMLIKKNILTRSQLSQLQFIQQKSGARLTQLVLKYQYATKKKLRDVIIEHKNLRVIPHKKVKVLKQNMLKGFTQQDYRWMIERRAYPVAFDLSAKKIEIAIYDVLDETLRESISLHFKKFKVIFCVIKPKKKRHVDNFS